MRSLILLLLLVLGGCGEDLDAPLRAQIRLLGLTGNPIADPQQQVMAVDDPRVQLGMLLFFSRSLSGSGEVACASCHHPFLGGADALSLSVGIHPSDINSVGHRRVNEARPTLVPRNAPTTFNSSLYQRHLFFDGRIERLNAFSELPPSISTPEEHIGDPDPLATSLLQAQAGFPVASEEEMRGDYVSRASNRKLRENLTRNLIDAASRETPDDPEGDDWFTLFAEVFPGTGAEPEESINFPRIRQLLADYQSSQILVDTPWRAYVEGDESALTNKQKRGALLFFGEPGEGGAGCAGCHSGDFFTDEDFHVLSIPQFGDGKDLDSDDRGRYLRTGVLDDRHAFRTPSLINVELTAPYGHTGAYETLESVVRHHLNPERAVEEFDYTLSALRQTGIPVRDARNLTLRALKSFKQQQNMGLSKLPQVALDDSQIDDIVAFLHGLTDPCGKTPDCLGKWIPDPNQIDPDGSLLRIVFDQH